LRYKFVCGSRISSIVTHQSSSHPICRTSFGACSFSVTAPTTWNSLPPAFRMCNSTGTFHRHLKTQFTAGLPVHLAPSSYTSDSALADHCPHSQIIFTYLQRAVKWLCVCVCVLTCKPVQLCTDIVMVIVCSVVVSQWVTMLDVVNCHLVREGFTTCTIRGDVPVKQRSHTVDMFNNDARGPSVRLPLLVLVVYVQQFLFVF